MKQHRRKLEDLDISQVKNELKRVKYNRRRRSVLKSTSYTLLIAAACAVLIATILMPVLQIYGNSMEPTLSEGEIVLSVKGMDFEQGDLISFYIGNKLLVKRYIAGPGQWVNITENGDVYVDNKLLNEEYLSSKAFGDCDIEMPYKVPDGRYFVIGDNRTVSVDSRNTAVGCISEEQIVGRIIFRVWPLPKFGDIE